MKRLPLVVVLACVALAFGLGCKKGGTGSAEDGAKAIQAVQVPAEPDKAIQAAVDALKGNKPVEVYAMLPESYRKDIQAIVTEATAGLDKELFELAVQILDTAVSCIDKHGDKIKSTMGAGAPFDLAAVFTQVKDLHGLLKEMKLLDYDSVKALDVAGFLAKNGEKIMQKGMDAFKTLNAKDYEDFQKNVTGIAIKVVEKTDTAAKLEITAGGETETVELTKVDGRWVPKMMAEGWTKMVEEAKKNVKEGLAEAAKNKEQAKAMMTQVLDGLKKFESSGDMAGLMGMAALMK